MTDQTKHAIEIWQAGVDAVSSERLVANAVQRFGNRLTICGEEFDLDQFSRIAIVGAGKAGAGMADSILNVLGDAAAKVSGWVNVPADCVRDLDRVTLHAARPAGVNEPTEAGVYGSQKILELVRDLDEDDLCLVLLSGGGSALLPAPIEGISLADKQQVTRQLMHGGASIGELNCVRKKLSSLKGGGLARACKAKTIRGLIISDVIDDPLDVIASGPTTEDSSTPAEALEILSRIVGLDQVPEPIVASLQAKITSASGTNEPLINVGNHIIGNNKIAVLAASAKAVQLGYQVIVEGIGLEGIASEVGTHLAEHCLAKLHLRYSICLLSGGEPTVRLAQTDTPRKGGRNQELVLAALARLQTESHDGIVILSGGTDGEDGPTDAAGAWVDSTVIKSANDLKLVPDDYLSINDSYHFFERAGGLLKTGPTHTNVMDVRVAIVGRPVPRSTP
jgi:hydroxypyruvate reductase